MVTFEASSLFNLHLCNPLGLQNSGRARRKYVLSVTNWRQQQQKNRGCNTHALQVKGLSLQNRLPTFSISCSLYNQGCADSEADTCNSEEPLILKKKAEEIAPDLNGTSIFLVGMMGCGKTTVGKILSEALGYYFFDSDRLVEQAAGGTSVAQIFKDKDEEFFRDAESKVLSQLSTMHRLVVATGGGAVIRPKNWSYLRHGITIWLDVPLEALAKRVVAVGTESRPLLGHDSANAYSQAFARLTELIGKRHNAYSNSDAKVSLEKIAAELGYEDVSGLTPTIIALEATKFEDLFGLFGRWWSHLCLVNGGEGLKKMFVTPPMSQIFLFFETCKTIPLGSLFVINLETGHYLKFSFIHSYQLL